MEEIRNKELLIEFVKSRECLWNMCSREYKLKQADKNVMWREIAEKLRLDVNTVKAMWRSLRDQFVRENKRPVSGSAAPDDLDGSGYAGGWHFFKLFLFLRATVTPRRTSGNLPRNRVVPLNKETDNNNREASSVQNELQHGLIEELNIPDYGDNLNDGLNDTEVLEKRENPSDLLQDIPTDYEEEIVTQDIITPTTSADRSTPAIGVCNILRKSDRVFALEEQKIGLFRKRLDQAEKRDSQNDDPDFCFVKSLLPELTKAKRKSTLKRKICELIDDFLEEESWQFSAATEKE